jgi:CelD/BcsL family acetyltransferase involved in cellulose biosynthesis
MTTEMRAKVETLTAKRLQELAGPWSTLTKNGPCAEPFFQQYWLQAFAATNVPESSLAVVVGSDGSTIRGLLPLQRTNRFFGSLPARGLRSLSAIHSCRYDLIHNEEDPAPLAAVVWRALRETPGWQVLEALDVPEDGSYRHIVDSAQADGFVTGVWPTRRSPFLVLPESAQGALPQAALTNCPREHKSYRSRLGAKLRQLQREGRVEFEVCTRDHPRVLEEFMTLEASGWKGARGSAIGLNWRLVEQYRRIAAGAAESGHLRIYTLRVDKRPIAMQFGIAMGGTYYAPKVAYAEEYGRFSPGQLLVHHIIQELVRAGFQRYDFLGPRARWKSVWTDRVRQHNNYYIFRPGIRGQLLCTLSLRAGAVARALHHRLRGDPQAL